MGSLVIDAHGLGVGLPEPHAARFLIQGCFRNRLLQHLAVEAEQARLFHRQRTAELAAELLQPLSVDLAEGLDRNLGSADRGDFDWPIP